MILITGAGGKTGKALVKTFAQVEETCALVYREEQISILKSLGAQKVILGDMRDEHVLRSAMQGVTAVYHICPNMSPEEIRIGKLVTGEAKRADVEHFVYHSVLHPQTEKMTHHWQKMRVEEMIFESGLPYTILQPAPYMQNLLANWKSVLDDGILHVPYSVGAKFSFVDLEDVAEAAKIVLTEPSHKNAVYELAGTFPWSHVEVAEVFSRVLKCNVRAEKEEIGDWKLRASTAFATNTRSDQRDDYMIENLIAMFEYYDEWGLVGNPNVLSWLLKREPTSLEAFVERARKEHE